MVDTRGAVGFHRPGEVLDYGVYIHLPWCRIRCPYCAFVVSADPNPPHAQATAALLHEWSLRRSHFEGAASTAFFGGGTPSRTPADHLGRILRGIAPRTDAEVSLEANPDELDDDGLSALRDAGINRLSLGVQSFSEAVAQRLGRTRSARTGRAMATAALARFDSVSVDLLFAAPGQTLEAFSADLDIVIDLGVPHVSLYGLTIEPGTPFARAGYPPPDEDRWADMYAHAVARLGEVGISRYEVSNFARAGHRCRHNEHYWRARPWAGLGPGAHAWWPDGTRAANTDDVSAWLGGADPLREAGRPAPRVLAAELIGSTVRHVDGLDLGVLHHWTGLITTPAPAHVKAGLVRQVGAHIVLESAGFPVADGIAAALCARLVPRR